MSNELQKIDFHGDTIFASRDEETGKIYVSLRAICDSLGISFQGQHKKLTTDPAFEDSLRYQSMLTPGGKQDVLCIESESLHGLLFSIQTNRLKPEVREMHILFKKESFKVLHDYFVEGIAVNPRAENLTGLTKRVERLELKLSQKDSSPLLIKKPTGLSPEIVRNRILEAIASEEQTTAQLYDFFNRHVKAQTLHAALNQLLQENLIVAHLQLTLPKGRPATLFCLG